MMLSFYHNSYARGMNLKQILQRTECGDAHVRQRQYRCLRRKLSIEHPRRDLDGNGPTILAGTAENAHSSPDKSTADFDLATVPGSEGCLTTIVWILGTF